MKALRSTNVSWQKSCSQRLSNACARAGVWVSIPALDSLCRTAPVAGRRTVAKVVVDVVLKPEILDPQGQAIVGALGRLGIAGVRDVRQGKHFELDVEDGVDDATLGQVAHDLLSNPVIEEFSIHRSA